MEHRPEDISLPPLGRYIALGQGLFYLITGIWPLIDVGSFQRVTGPKFDLWLVKTVGILITVIGSVLMISGVRKDNSPEIELLASGSAAALAGIDTVYVARKRISPIYLADAIAEFCLILTWLFVVKARR